MLNDPILILTRQFLYSHHEHRSVVLTYLLRIIITSRKNKLSLIIFSSFLDIFIECYTPLPPRMCCRFIIYIYMDNFHTHTQSYPQTTLHPFINTFPNFIFFIVSKLKYTRCSIWIILIPKI